MPLVTTTEAGVPIQGPSATLIYDDWYPALRTDTLRKGKLATAMLLGIPLVLGRRSDGRVFAMRDSCPHRGIPLSEGWFDGNRVTCRYHGWEFEPCSGRCELIPSLSSHDHLDATRIYATAFPCEERDGHAWVYHSGSGLRRKVFAECASPCGTGARQVRPALSHRPSRCRPALQRRPRHHRSDGSGARALRAPGLVVAFARQHPRKDQERFEPIPEGFRMSAHAPSGNSAPYKLLGVYGQPVETTIDFVLPNRRTEIIRCGDKWFSSLTTVTPVTASTCRIDVIAAWNVFYNVPFLTPIAKFFGAKFVRQDQETMIQQAEGLKHNPSLMLIDDADKPAKWYFALKQARLDGTGKHPLDGPVELHWRS